MQGVGVGTGLESISFSGRQVQDVGVRTVSTLVLTVSSVSGGIRQFKCSRLESCGFEIGGQTSQKKCWNTNPRDLRYLLYSGAAN